MPYGHDDATWEQAKEDARAVIAERARVRGMIPYSELVSGIHAIQFDPHDAQLFHLLGEISKEEDEAGRGMMTALVVHKYGDMEPGPGFFELAQELGRNASDVTKCWIEECKVVHAAWAQT